MSKDGLLSGKRVLVTGAGQGNGRAIAEGMARAGAEVVVVDLNEATARDTAKALGTSEDFAFALDIADREGALGLADAVSGRIGQIDCLVNNAGILLRGKLSDPDAANAWDRTISVNVTGTYNMVQAFRGSLTESKGSIINIGSIQSFVAAPNSAAYTASKGAVLQLTKALAVELARDGIRVNGIAPGVMRTPMTVETMANEAAIGSLLRHIPMRRVGEAQELAGPAVFLASDLASYVTGVMLPVDGGYLSM
ncbi:MAG: glucose 1-dehydrogenase [Hyphomicrobiaceae bacterium]|nr:glucose 1-dehydrogenase [Hyphomicrobiaceae bacterium]